MMVTSKTRRNMTIEEKKEAIRLEKESIRLQKQSIRFQKEAIRLAKEEIRLQKESIRLEKQAPKLDQGFYELEDVREKRVRKGQTQYLIKWLGWPEKDNTWEPIENLQQCLDVVTAFEERLHLRGRKRKLKLKSCSQDDRNFTFEVGSQPNPSERTGDDQRPFPTDLLCASQSAQGSPPRITACQVESKMLSLVTQGSPSTKQVTQVNSKMSSHASHGSPQKSGWRKARKSSKGHKPADDTATSGTEAPNDNGSPLENQLLLCHKESHEEPISCIPHNPGKFDLLKDDRSFTLKVTSHAHLVETEIGNGGKPFPSLQPNDVLQTGGTSPIMSSFCQTDLNTIQDISFANTQTSGAKSKRRRSWVDDKARSGSGKVVDRVAAKEGKALEEVTAREQIKGSGSNSLGTLSPTSFGVVNCVAPAEEMRPFGFKPSPVLTGQPSSLPDLNTSIPTSPLTDSQQVQLRAQIFVYGSLIDGTKPDEACMISAFGESDGGRSIWENVWRVAVFQHQKSPLSSAKLPAQETRSFCQSDTFSTPDQAGGVGAPPMISPLVRELEVKQIKKAQLQSDHVAVLQQKVEELENKNKELQEQLESVLCENRVLQEKLKREVPFEKKTKHMQEFGEESNYSKLSKSNVREEASRKLGGDNGDNRD